MTTAVSNLTSYPQAELEELENGETPEPRTPALQVAVRDLQTGVTQLVSVRRDPATGAPALNSETGEPEPVPTHVETGIYGAVDVEGVLPFFRAEVPAYTRTQKVGAAISADGSTVAWMGQQLGEQVPSMPANRRSTTGPSRCGDGSRTASLRPRAKSRVASDPESPACQASGEQRLPDDPIPGDPCQGPFETRLTDTIDPGEAGVWTGDPEDDFVPKLSGDGYTVAFLARAPLFGFARQEGGHSELYPRRHAARPDARRRRCARLTRFASLNPTAVATNSAITDVSDLPECLGGPAGRAGRVHDDADRVPAGLAELRLRSRCCPRAGRTVRRRPRQRHPDAGHAGLRRRPGRPPFREEKTDTEDPYLRFGLDDGDARALVRPGRHRARVLLHGLEPGVRRQQHASRRRAGAEDGADIFSVTRLTFAASAPEQSISAAPPNPAPEVPWKLGVTAQSLRNGHVRLYLSVPGGGTIRAAATGDRRAAAHPRSPSIPQAGAPHGRELCRRADRPARSADAGPRARPAIPLACEAQGRSGIQRARHVRRGRPPPPAVAAAGAVRDPREGWEAMSLPRTLLLALIALAVALAAPSARAEPLADEAGAEWRLEQPEAPEAPPGVERPSWLVGLGHIGDIEFYAAEPRRAHHGREREHRARRGVALQRCALA